MGNNKPLLWTAILTAAGTGSAMAQITGTPTAGDFYFKDVATGKFLGAGNAYGTQASLNGGILFTMTIEDGKYILDSKRERTASTHYLSTVDGSNNLFVDQAKCGFELVEKSAGQYVIKVGNAYLISDGNVVAAGSEEAKAAVWQILPVKDLTKAFAGASFSSPACATPLIKTPDFSKYIDNKSGWTINDPWNNPGLNSNNNNPCMEFWNRHFKIDQTLSEIPNGLYRLTVQGFDRYSAGQGDATTNVRAKLFANGSSVDMPSVNREAELKNNYEGDIKKAPDNMDQASTAFSAGLYKSDPLYVYVDNNTLNIGIEKKEDGGWCIFDNFELAYVGDINMDAIHKELTEKLAVVINQAGKYESDPTLQKLALDAAKIQTDINEIGNKTAKGFELAANYLDNVKDNLGQQIDEISKKIDTANKNFEAYEKAKKIHGGEDGKGGLVAYRQTNLIDVYDAAEAATKEAAKTLYETTSKLVDDFLTDAKKAYEAGTAGSVDFAAKETAIKEAIDGAKDAITKGSTNELSYANVNTIITKADDAYKAEAANLYTLLAGAVDGKVYTDTYTEALAEINSYSRKIKDVKANNDADHAAGKCNSDTQDQYTGELAKIIAALPSVYDKYLAKVGATTKPASGTLRGNYAAANADILAVTNSLTEDIKYADESVSKHYATTVQGIKDKITALQSNVDAANAAHTIKGEAPFCDKYNEDKKVITDAIADLSKKVAKSNSEFNADKASKDAILAVQGKLDAAQTAVKALASDDKQYDAAAKFAATATAIQTAINAVTDARSAAYKVDGTGTAADFFSKVNDDVTDKEGKVTRKGLTTIEGEITAYEADANAALTAYNTVANALAAYDLALNGKPAVGEEGKEGYVEAVPGLKQIAKKLAVTVDGDLKSKTYEDSIKGLEVRIKVVSDALTAANDKLDAEHKAAITAIDIDAKIAVEIKALSDNYATNETKWNKANTEAAKARLLADADRRVKDLAVPTEDYDVETYGKTATELNEELKPIRTAVAGVSTEIETAKNSSDDAAAIALLSEVVTKLEGIQKDFTALTTKAKNAETEYAAEKAAKADFDKTIAKLKASYSGGKVDNVEYKGIAAEAGESSSSRFTAEISNVKALITALESEVAASFANETLRVDSKDVTEVKDEAGNVTTAAKEGYTTRATSIDTAISNLITLAKAEKANDDAKTAFEKKVADAKVAAAITKAETDIKAADKDNETDGEKYFLGKLAEYETAYNKIVEDAATAHAARAKSELSGAIKDAEKYTDTSKNMTANAESLASRLSTVKSNIEGLKALAEANETEHNAQTKAGAAAKTQWDELFAEITNSEVSSAHEAAIATLNEAKTALETYNKNVSTAFGNGECSTKKTDLEGELTAITNKLNQLKSGWGDDYKAAIADDNAKRKTAFDNAYTLLLDTYKQKTELVNKLSKLSYASGSNGTLATITGEGGIFSYIDKIRTLKTEAENSYKETAAPDLWDAEKQYQQKASDFSEAITDLATQYSDEVNKEAEGTYNRNLSDVLEAYTDALDHIQSTLHVDAKDAEDALSDVKTILTEAQNKAQKKDDKFVNPDFAYELDNTILPAFATVADKIVADKEAAAESTWKSTIQYATQLATSELAAIQAMGIDKADEGATYSKPYEEFVKKSIDAAAEAWAKVEEGKKYANYGTPYDFLSDFTGTYVKRNMTPDETDEAKKKYETHTARYWTAYDAEQKRIANDAQYQSMLTKFEELQKAKNDAADFLASLMVMHDAELNDYLNVAQFHIDWVAKDAETYKKNPNHSWVLGWFESDTRYAIQYTDRIYNYTEGLVDKDAIAKENAAISLEIGNLYKDYDLAVAQDVENTELDKYKASIDEFTKENEKIYSEHTVGIIIGYDEETKAPIYKTEKDKDGNEKNVTTTPEEARDAYVALEKKIGEVKTALTEIGDAAHIDATIASVNEAIAALQTEVDKLNAQLADCHEPVVNKYQGDVDAVAASIEAAKADLQTATDEKTILLYADNIIKTVNDVKAGTSTLAYNINNSEAPFDTNDAKYAELCGKIKDKTDKLQEVYNASLEYEFAYAYDYKTLEKVDGKDVEVDHHFDDAREGRKAQIEYYIALSEADLKTRHDAIKEDGTNGLRDWSSINWQVDIDAYINIMERELARDNQISTQDAANILISEGHDKYSEVVDTESERFYPSTEVEQDVYKEYKRLNNRLWNDINNYAWNAWWNGTTVDLEGKEFTDSEGNVIPKTYLEVYPDIMAALAQVRKDAEQFKKDAWDKSCLKGDVDNNDNITVNDYNYVRNIIIGELEIDTTDPRFLAADVNEDGKINIADVIQMANKIMTDKFVPATEETPTRIAALFPEKAEANGLSVVAQGSGTKQFVNISLNDVANFVGAQMDVTLPAGVSLVGATAGAGQEVVFGEVDGVTRLVISNINNDGFAGNDIVTLEVEVSSDYKTGAVIVDNALFSDSRGALYIIGGGASDGATGFTELTAGEKVMNKIYSVGGQIMNSLKKGVNIIINSDGSSRKVNQK